MKNLLTLDDLRVDEIHQLVQSALDYKQGKGPKFLGKIAVNLFFEPSTRTHYSFCVAANKLGMQVINFEGENSSLIKGESFYDTIKTFDSFNTDVLIIRDRKDKYYEELIGKINTPLINAGDGASDHPSQTLLDLVTIYEEFKTFDGLKVVIIGDIKHSRVARSNIKTMKRLGMEVYTSGPSEFLDLNFETIDFNEAIETMDVVMLLRVQNERHESKKHITDEQYLIQYGITKERINKMKEKTIIMHPAPVNRNVEIASDCVEDPKSRIFKQMENGVYARQAIIKRSMLDE